ncbi:uncharacterized protein EI90DRAFT_3290710 [Cantharellus anzutake]|uniref:uncharacterized protein n=1 Tax=Cantharellus anzutake TaxID=1750568 RepID=UPI00190583FD|nr:uncharacterized protein EI90DRAFT_3290710 [Cantharellus anzutake]KAF8328215.1 hypothetical protein EI90DRAFT_3290710 [Cantharellus anzutake]
MSFEEVLSKREDHPFIVQDKQYTMRAAASTSSPSCDIDCTPKILRMLNSIELELRAECQKAASKSNEAHLSSPQPLTQDTPSIPPPIHGDASVENKSLVSEKSGRDAGPGARRWICPPPCGKSFTREHHLPRHMKSSSCVHNQQKISETLRKRKAEAPRTKPRAGNTSVKGGSAKNSKSSSPRPSSSRGVQDVPLRTLDGKFICVACKMSFSRNDHLKRHQSLSCKAGRGAATPRTRSIRCGPLLKGAISRAHKWLASIDEEGTGGEDRVERLSSSDLGILGLGGCSEDDEAFDCPGW